MKIFVGVIAHKKYWMPKDDLYVPIQVGGAFQSPIYEYRDDIGDNISNKNKNFCELTGLYWMWKNISKDYDYLGLVHYRRYFANKKFPSFDLSILTKEKVDNVLRKYDAILPKKFFFGRKTVFNNYKSSHHINDLMRTKDIISRIYPQYLSSFDKVLKRHSIHAFNMFIMKKEYFNSYCEWLFNILFELEKEIDISDYDEYNKRVFGFISERLLDVWLDKNKIKYKEYDVKFIESN